jgi:uncharacterized membrane protein YjjP (DUF1212 family)
MVRHVPLGSVHLERISELNQLSREICQGQVTVDQAIRRVDYCRRLPSADRMTALLAGGMGCAGFGYIYGCRLVECILAFLLGVVLQWFLLAAGKAGVSKFIINIIGSLLVSVISFGLAAMGMDILQDKVVIGAIYLLVPGVSLTTSIRELFNGDYLSGCIHLADALLTAVCIAVGVGAAVKMFQLFGGAGL